MKNLSIKFWKTSTKYFKAYLKFLHQFCRYPTKKCCPQLQRSNLEFYFVKFLIHSFHIHWSDMKSIWVIGVFLACAFAKPREGFQKTYRYFKITCTSSNKTCVNPFCFIKNSRNDSKYSAGCDIIKPINELYVIFWTFRFFSSWQLIIFS